MTRDQQRIDRERELFAAWSHARDLDEPTRTHIRDELITMHAPLVRHIARRYANRGEPLEDITQVGTIGLMKAIDRFESERGLAFSTYATALISGEIKRYFRDHTWSVHVPRSIQDRGRAVSRATEQLQATLDRTPTVQEIADQLELRPADVLEALEGSHAHSSLPLETPTGTYLREPTTFDHEIFEMIDNRETLMPLLAQLDERQQAIIKMRFLDGRSQSDIAQELGISQMHVSRLLQKALEFLRTGLQESGDFG
jgi:RNA polymerase sigma-B factor